MAAYELEHDEAIILQSTSAYRSGPSEEDFEDEELMELVVTNKRIIYVSEISKGFFSKTTTEVIQTPITDIKVINGVVQVKQIKHDMYGHCIQIQFVHGIEYWNLEKKAIPQWITEINRLLGAELAPVQEAPAVKEKKAPAFEAFSGFAAAFKNAADTATQVVSSAVKQVTDNSLAPIPAPVVENLVEDDPFVTTPQTSTNRFCSNCGSKIDGSAKFCSGCGAPVNGSTIPAPPPVPVAEPTPPVAHHEERQQKYVGTIFKCPNCGAVIGETTVVCSDCGFRITGRSAVSSVQTFKEQLMEIESTRKSRAFEMFNISVQPADTRKLSLIRSFPIPNTFDDIQEFMLLAIANIDVNLSKQTMMNKYYASMKTAESTQTISKTISDAWVAKMQQAYQKAELLFPDDPAFTRIQKLYFEKMKELKIKIN